MEKLDAVVIGAGVIGLAIARELALQGREVVVLEQHKTFGQETSSRNSEVIHAGIYYPKGSLKAQYCVAGKTALYRYCKERNIPHQKIGKMIVASDNNELKILESYLKKAQDNGVLDLELIDAQTTKQLEPNVHAAGAVLSPSTGIIDSHHLMLSFIGDIEANGGFVVYDSPVTSGSLSHDNLIFSIGGSSPTQFECQSLINAAGLSAIDVAKKLGLAEHSLPQAYYAIGHYYSLLGKSPFNRLIYPLANNAGLGVHATLDLNQQVKFGPDVRWINRIDYSFDDSKRDDFVAAIRRYYPDIDQRELSPGYTGIRPKISSPTQSAADFTFQSSDVHGIKGLVNLYGIESPGLTSSMIIAKHVLSLLDQG